MPESKASTKQTSGVSRRQFVKNMAAVPVVAAGTSLAAEAAAVPAPATRKLKLGLIGCGHRGTWITDFFLKHGGFVFTAVADYFQAAADACGQKLGVDPSRRFSGLSGYKKVIASGVDALVVEDVPCFYPEQVSAAIDAGCHVFVAKPFAIDVPGVMTMLATAKKATEKKLCFLVDYQLPTDPANQEVRRRVREGALGTPAYFLSGGTSGPAWPDPKRGPTIENLLGNFGWASTVALSGEHSVAYDIHIIDGITWVTGKRPVAATGRSRRVRAGANGDATDCGAVLFEYDDGTLWNHTTQTLRNNSLLYDLSADLMGNQATARFGYAVKAFVRGGPLHYSAAVSGTIYKDGVAANVAEFHRTICAAAAGGKVSNPAAFRSVDGTLTAILGREAMTRGVRLTMDDILRENKKLEIDLRGLKE